MLLEKLKKHGTEIIVVFINALLVIIGALWFKVSEQNKNSAVSESEPQSLPVENAANGASVPTVQSSATTAEPASNSSSISATPKQTTVTRPAPVSAPAPKPAPAPAPKPKPSTKTKTS